MFRQLQMPQQPSQPQHRDGQEPVVQFQKVNGCDFEKMIGCLVALIV